MDTIILKPPVDTKNFLPLTLVQKNACLKDALIPMCSFIDEYSLFMEKVYNGELDDENCKVLYGQLYHTCLEVLRELKTGCADRSRSS